MAIIHKARISPTKAELLDGLFGEPTTTLGTYRYDDPAGEVGIEGFVVRVGEATKHVALTYRGAPLESARLVSTMEHSALGQRWIYDAATDPVALAAFRRALRGEQAQAPEEIWDGDKHLSTREPSARISLVSGDTAVADGTPILVADLDTPPADDAGTRLTATWAGSSAAIAYLAR